MQRSLKEELVIHISYRDIFNAPVRLDECKRWLRISSDNLHEFQQAINELKEENLIEEKDGFLCVKHKEEIISLQPEKDRLTRNILAKGKRFLSFVSNFPFIRYIGVSGSIAANNPTADIGSKDGFVDLDLFVVCRPNTLWLLYLVERIHVNLKRLFGRQLFYCFNYVTDESFLEVYNKNLYTATEIINLKTIYDDQIFGSFMDSNGWYKRYYPNMQDSDKIETRASASIWALFAPLNYLFFALFCIARAIKRFKYRPLLEMFGGFNPSQRCNLKRISNPNGGYQEAIKGRFAKLFQKNFPNYFSEEIMDDLFPTNSAFEISVEKKPLNTENVELFSKYA